MVFLMFYLCANKVIWQFDQTEIFRDLDATQVAVAPNGSVYLADTDQGQILQVSPPGVLIQKIGRKGNGPGEFNHLYQIFFDRQRLYAYDYQQDRLSVFKPGGTFIEAIRVPKRRVRLLKIPQGWLIGDWQKVGGPEDPGLLFRAGEAMENPVEILRLPGPFYHGGLRVNRTAPGKAFFTPFSAKPQMRLSQDRKFAYVAGAHQFVIYVIATGDGRLVRTLKREVNSVPMDRDWVDTEMAAVKRDLGGKIEAKVTANTPDRFPAIRNFWALPNGHLAIELWRGKPDSQHLLVGLSAKGETIGNLPAWHDLNTFKQSFAGRRYHLVRLPGRDAFSLIVKDDVAPGPLE